MAEVELWCRITVVGSDGSELACHALRGPGHPDLAAVDDVARAALYAHRRGGDDRARRRRARAGVAARPGRARRRGGGAGRTRGRAARGRGSRGRSCIPTIRPSEISSTCRAHGAWPPAGSGLYWPKAGQPLADVASSREPRQALGPGSTIHRPMFVRALEPHRERRHRLHGVLVQQRDQPLDVVALEGVDVALEQLGVGRRRAARDAARSGRSCERGSGPLQRAVHRGHARVEQLRHLGSPASAAPRRG